VRKSGAFIIFLAYCAGGYTSCLHYLDSSTRSLMSRRLILFVALCPIALTSSDGGSRSTGTRGHRESAFAQFVDGYLERFATAHPSIAAGNGIHTHDGALEDFSAAAIEREVAQLRRDATQLDAMPETGSSVDERVDRRILRGLVDAWLLELATIQNWRKNPMIYAAAISDGVHDLMTMESDSATVRLRRITSKLQGVPRLLASAQQNITNPPPVFVRHAIRMLEGVPDMLDHDIPLAFANVKDERLWSAEREAADGAKRAIAEYVAHLHSQESASGSFVIGAANLSARYRAEELIDVPLSQLLAIGERELGRREREFAQTARLIDSTRAPLDVWQGVLRDHPGMGQVVPAAKRAVDELIAFGTARRLVDLPTTERPTVAAAPPFDIGLASMHSSPPLEPHPVKSFYYVTDAQASWPRDRQDAWLQHFNYADLAIISAHEVYPGHWAHSLYMRRTPGKIRKIWIGLNPFPQPSSGQDGWAHYAEQLVIEQGFHAGEPKYKLAQLSEAMTRLCRLVVGIQLHSGGWTVDQGAAFFEQNAHLPAPAARQEAERGTYDPTYGGYALGKLAALKLRADVKAKEGAAFDLRRFHERVMTDGIAPWWAHRQLLLPGDSGKVVE
jgi:uncharacterized protein (DUF885 family)